ncbi:MAG TPA: 3-deoxy-manno-octulosonate cytidylyltransferase [Gemmataceae bacterium]|nr:3-deoxy-manno-octulosonate cytidylyltransferase [Gemmataceae bacterium]
MHTAVVIPARYASSRLPGKPLLRETGKYLIQHVYERACQAHADAVIVATDDQRIFEAVRDFGGSVVMTRDDHPSGTDRIAEVAQGLAADVVVNLQGDEPMIDPAALDQLQELLHRDPGADVATLATPITSLEQYRDPNCVKVVCDKRGRALYFSRSPIPYVREGQPNFSQRPAMFLQHLGLYAYRRDFLLKLAQLPPEPLEDAERLEQLRVLANGKGISVGVVEHAGRGVDTPADYRRFVEMWRGMPIGKAA